MTSKKVNGVVIGGKHFSAEIVSSDGKYTTFVIRTIERKGKDFSFFSSEYRDFRSSGLFLVSVEDNTRMERDALYIGAVGDEFVVSNAFVPSVKNLIENFNKDCDLVEKLPKNISDCARRYSNIEQSDRIFLIEMLVELLTTIEGM